MASGGKGARARNKERRKKEKAQKKASKAALYQQMALSGDNSKNKNKRSEKARNRVRTVKHKTPSCGNVGCKRCTPYNFHAWMVNGVLTGAPQKVYEAYLRTL